MSQWLNGMGHTLANELQDLIDLHAMVRLGVRLVMAAILGGVIGYERGRRGKAAGIRTHMLVAIGSALFLAVPNKWESIRPV
jgi:putative Mg2+ transporter-C (MgtC) family protein